MGDKPEQKKEKIPVVAVEDGEAKSGGKAGEVECITLSSDSDGEEKKVEPKKRTARKAVLASDLRQEETCAKKRPAPKETKKVEIKKKAKMDVVKQEKDDESGDEAETEDEKVEDEEEEEEEDEDEEEEEDEDEEEDDEDDEDDEDEEEDEDEGEKKNDQVDEDYECEDEPFIDLDGPPDYSIRR